MEEEEEEAGGGKERGEVDAVAVTPTSAAESSAPVVAAVAFAPSRKRYAEDEIC